MLGEWVDCKCSRVQVQVKSLSAGKCNRAVRQESQWSTASTHHHHHSILQPSLISRPTRKNLIQNSWLSHWRKGREKEKDSQGSSVSYVSVCASRHRSSLLCILIFMISNWIESLSLSLSKNSVCINLRVQVWDEKCKLGRANRLDGQRRKLCSICIFPIPNVLKNLNLFNVKNFAL